MAAEAKPTYYVSTGRRKTAVARIRLCDGTGKLEINGRPHDEYFKEEKDRVAVMAPLQTVDLVGKLDVRVKVHGGGFSGQAGAVCQGIARAIKSMITPADQPPLADGEKPVIPPLVRKLREAGLLTRDPRMKERKKYGHKGARKSFQFSKR